MRRTPSPAALLLLLTISCAPDPAVEVARCLERGLRDLRASGGQERTVVCELHVEGPHVVVLHPGGPHEPEMLRAAGVPEEALDPIRRWREDDAAVYVVPLDPAGGGPAMTTSQSFFVAVPRLLAVAKADPHTSILLRRGADGVETSGMW